MILVKTFFAYNELRNYSYLITDDQTGESWAIDPYEAHPIISYIKKNGLVLQGILNTHQHFDHIRGNEPLMQAFQIEVKRLNNSEKIKLSSAYSIESLFTPGHTLDHQAFIWKKDGTTLALFSGDTLFNSGVGNCHGGGDVNLLFETTESLVKNLPAATLLYPGHDYRLRNLEFAHKVEPDNTVVNETLLTLSQVSTEDLPPATLGEEMRMNPFLRLHSEEIKQNVMKTAKNEKELFIQLRKLRDQW